MGIWTPVAGEPEIVMEWPHPFLPLISRISPFIYTILSLCLISLSQVRMYFRGHDRSACTLGAKWKRHVFKKTLKFFYQIYEIFGIRVWKIVNTQYVRYIPYYIIFLLAKNQFLCLRKRIMSLRNFNFLIFQQIFLLLFYDSCFCTINQNSQNICQLKMQIFFCKKFWN